MRIIKEFSDEEKLNALNDLYNSFASGYDFEVFLKPFLEKIGLTEVVVTKKSGDDGVDLIAIKEGLIDLNGTDRVIYRVQAKRIKPSNSISPEKIDALRGNLLSGEKGLFITTGKVSKGSKEKAITKDPSKPVIVIDGLDLISICADKEIGFAYKPIFSKTALQEILDKNKTVGINDRLQSFMEDSVRKKVTSNDIRARIISVPSVIVEKMKLKHKDNIEIIFNEEKYTVTFISKRNYIAGVTDILKKYKFIDDDGSYKEKNIEWAISNDNKLKLYVLE